MRTLEGCYPFSRLNASQSMPMAGAATPPGCVPFLLSIPGVERPLSPPPANGLQAFGLNEASSLTVREESRDCPPLLIAPKTTGFLNPGLTYEMITFSIVNPSLDLEKAGKP